MKKLFALMLAAALALSLVACSSSKKSSSNVKSNVSYNSTAVDSDLVESTRDVFLKYYDIDFSITHYEKTGDYTAEATLIVTVEPKIPNPDDSGIYQIDLNELSVYLPAGAIGAGWWDAVDIKSFSEGKGGNYFATKPIEYDTKSTMYVKEEFDESTSNYLSGNCLSNFHVGYDFDVYFDYTNK